MSSGVRKPVISLAFWVASLSFNFLARLPPCFLEKLRMFPATLEKFSRFRAPPAPIVKTFLGASLPPRLWCLTILFSVPCLTWSPEEPSSWSNAWTVPLTCPIAWALFNLSSSFESPVSWTTSSGEIKPCLFCSGGLTGDHISFPSLFLVTLT